MFLGGETSRFFTSVLRLFIINSTARSSSRRSFVAVRVSARRGLPLLGLALPRLGLGLALPRLGLALPRLQLALRGLPQLELQGRGERTYTAPDRACLGRAFARSMETPGERPPTRLRVVCQEGGTVHAVIHSPQQAFSQQSSGAAASRSRSHSFATNMLAA